MGETILFTEEWEFIGEVLPSGRGMLVVYFTFILVQWHNRFWSRTAIGVLCQLPIKRTVLYLLEQISVVFGFSLTCAMPVRLAAKRVFIDA